MDHRDTAFERRLKVWKRMVLEAGILYEARSRRYFRPRRERLAAKRTQAQRVAAKMRRHAVRPADLGGFEDDTRTR